LHGLSEGGSPGKVFLKRRKNNTAAACSLIFLKFDLISYRKEKKKIN
jgi:hypothetical protein